MENRISAPNSSKKAIKTAKNRICRKNPSPIFFGKPPPEYGKSPSFPHPCGQRQVKNGKFPAIIQNFHFPTSRPVDGDLWKRRGWEAGCLKNPRGLWKRESTGGRKYPQWGNSRKNKAFLGESVEIHWVSHSQSVDF